MLRAQQGKRGDSRNVTLGHLRPQKEVVRQDARVLRPAESVGSSGGSWGSEGIDLRARGLFCNYGITKILATPEFSCFVVP